MNDFLDRHKDYLKYLLLLSLISFVILFVATTAHGAWYDGNWLYRKQITIKSSEVTGGPHSNFPVLISRTTDTELAADARNDGYDILFTSSDEVTKIAHEREKFDGGTGELVAWVKVGSVSSSGNTVIYMYYGNPSAGDQQLVAPTKSDVWSDYVGAWHLHDDFEDSTSNNNDGINTGSTDATGQIADGQSFNGTGNYIQTTSSELKTANSFTISTWFKTDALDYAHHILWQGEVSGNGWGSDDEMHLSIGECIVAPCDQGNRLSFFLGTDGSDITADVIALGTDFTDTTNRNFVAVTVSNLSTSPSAELFLNGVSVSTDTGTTAYTGRTLWDTALRIGRPGSSSRYWDGLIDEVRISNIVRSADWIATEYNNQNNSANFVIVGSQWGSGSGNLPPNVNAGLEKTVTLPASASLSDATASDPDSAPGPFTTTWSKVSGPGTVTFGDINVVNTTASFSQDGTYVLKLTANDGLDTTEDTVTITVNPPGAPPIGDYSCNMKITIQGSQVQGGPHDDFPVLISLTDESLKTSGCGFVTSDDGYDILFTNSSKSSQLAHEIEKYDKDAGELIAWVKVDLNASPSNTDIYMYYGNSNVTSPQESPANVWDTNYVGVWHLKETTGTHYDSTSGNNGTPGVGVIQDAVGKINGADDFDGNDDYVEVGTTGFSTTNMTFSAWVKADALADRRYIFGHTTQPAFANRIQLYTSGTAPSLLGLGLGDTHSKDTGSALSTGTWYHVALVMNATNYWVYLNSALDMSGTYTGLSTLQTYADIGNDGNPSERTESWNGVIDEVRISDVARSAEWIETSYNNQNDPSSFYSVEKNCPSTIPPIAEFTCSIPLTIDSSKVSGTSDLTNFPVLISLTNTSLRTTGSCGYVENSSGYDIIFSDATQTTILDHEIEKYDGASGELVAWVRVPTLKYNEDTVINIHYGHSSVCGASENPTGVWDSNYKGVWHLSDTSGATQDSTSYNTGGSLSGTVTRGATGQIGDAFNFYTNGEVDWGDPGDGHLDFGTGEMTLGLWVNMDNHRGVWEQIILKGKSSWQSGYQIEVNDSSNTFYFAISDGSISEWGRSATVSFSLDTWTHVVGVVDRSSNLLRAYKDGVEVDTTGISGMGSINVADELTIGRDSWGWPDARVDEVRLSNTARSADWIQTEYNNQSNPSSFYSVGASSCFLSGFSCNRRITIDSTKVAGSSDLTNFPFLLKIQNDCNIQTAANGGSVQNSSGWDIIFIDSDGVTQLDHEIEDYDGTTGDLTAWVRVPTLPYNSDKDIYMYYGKSGLTCDPSNATGVWDSNYEAVYHLNDDFEDSTSHNRDATAEDTDTYASVIADGENFGPQDEIAIGNWNFSGDELTLQTWARFDDFDQDDTRVFSKANATGEQGHVFMLGLGGTGENYLRMRIKTGTDDLTGTTTTVDTDDPLSTGTWYLIAGTYDGANMRLLSNGVEVHSAAKTGNLRVNSWNIALGNHPGNTSTTYTSMDGKLDEVRILSVVRSANWLRTEYNNQDAPDSFYSMSQDTCGGTYGFNFQYCKKITVDYTQVNSELYDFPLLINIANDDDLKTVANGGRIQHSQGWDIVFRTKGCGNLDHEIEKYDGANGNLVAWVSIPVLYADTDTEIYMYYGASNVICSPENPDGVWDSSYMGVWHLDETVSDESTAGTHYDSTSNDNDGSQTNNDDYTNGKIGTGQMFDGNGDYIYTTNSFNNPQNFTVSAWFKTSTASGKRVVGFESDQSGTNSGSWDRHIYVGTDGKVYFGAYSGSTDVAVSTNTLNDDTWHYAVGVRDDGADYIRLYIDGSLNNSTYNSNAENYSGWWRIGSYKSSGWPSGQDGFLPGVIDEVRISNTVRSAAWIQTSYNNQNNPNFYSVTSCFEQTQEVTQEWVEEVQ